VTSKDTRVSYCPHCGNTNPQKIVHTQPHLERIWYSDDLDCDENAVQFVAVCQTCNQILVYGQLEELLEEGFADAVLLWPKFGLNEAVPERIRSIYDEASRIQHTAPNAFAVQIRRALEAICIDRGATEGTLQQNIHELANRGEIPNTLVEASGLLRLIGNIGAHASDSDVHPNQASALNKFFQVIVEYLYVSPKMIEEFKARWNKSKK
jgi:uncharacterized protein DUF4145